MMMPGELWHKILGDRSHTELYLKTDKSSAWLTETAGLFGFWEGSKK
jgi:hypothetical protein